MQTNNNMWFVIYNYAKFTIQMSTKINLNQKNSNKYKKHIK